MCDNNMSVSAVARELNYHRNTIMFHLRKILEQTGLNPQRYHDLVELEKEVQKNDRSIQDETSRVHR